jgi:hypothetical protein
MRTKERRKAIKLRRLGETYSEIKAQLNLPKSTLSDWLKDCPLTSKQLAKLHKHIRYKKYIAIEKTRETKRQKREIRFKQIFEEEKKRILPINNRELYLAGLLLYLGEGVKGDNSTVGLNNTDPKVVKLFLYWLTHCLKVKKHKIRVNVHLYQDMNISRYLTYWSTYLSIPRSQFIKPYIKASNRSDLDQKGFGNGTCGLYIYDRKLKLKVMAGISAITGMI